MMIEYMIGRCLLIGFALICAWEDFQHKSIDIRVFIGMFIFEMIWYGYAVGYKITLCPMQILLGVAMGVVIYIISRITNGSIGDGDAIYFALTGILVGGTVNFVLILLTIAITGLCGLGYGAYCFAHGKNIRHKTMPMLPFAIPAVLIIAL